MTEEKNTITINGIEHNVADLKQEEQYMIAQIKDLEGKANNIKFQLDQALVAKEAFTNSLIKSIEEKKEVDNETEDGNNT
jgi:hypothetical protein